VPDAAAIRALLDADRAVVCGGGGGVPVIDGVDGLEGVAAVVDKDLTSAALAEAVGADRLVFLTDIDGAYIDYRTADERRLAEVDPETVRSYLADGEFGAGSMAPKMRAAARVAESGGTAVVAHVEDPVGALAAQAGTVVQPSNRSDS